MMEVRSHYTWRYVLSIFAQHKRTIVAAHAIAIGAAMFSVPVPLMLPLLVDEALLGERGKMLAVLDRVVPSSLHGPAAYIAAILLLTIVLRLVIMVLQVWQTRKFSMIAKDLIFRIRRDLLGRLRRVSMGQAQLP